MSVDFVLDLDEEDPHVAKRSSRGCGYKSNLQLTELLSGTHMRISLAVLVILVILCFMLRRKMGFKFQKHRKPIALGHRRPVEA